MASIYARGNRLWLKIKNGRDPSNGNATYERKPTPFCVGDETKAMRYAVKLEQLAKAEDGEGAAPALTIAAYAKKWIAAREALKLASVSDDEARLRLHVVPVLGHLPLAELRPKHVRELILAMKSSEKPLAPRTIRHVYSVLRTMVNDARADELIDHDPCILKRGVLPKKIDKDPTWRRGAIFTRIEVERLLSDARILFDRRVVYALKALGGFRHSEMAHLRWGDLDPMLEPLAALHLGKTKTQVPRSVPVHATLARILDAWMGWGWERTYGRQPTVEDYIVPARTLRPRTRHDAAHSVREDLEMLELRHRRGHDLRRTFISLAQEDGARRDILQTITHGPRGDIMNQYTTFTWPAMCVEVAKLRIELLDGKVLERGTALGTAEIRAHKRWVKLVTPPGLEPGFSA